METKNYLFFDTVMKNLNVQTYEQGHLFADEQWDYPESNAPFNRLYLIFDGEGKLIGEEGTVLLKKGYMYVVPMDSPYHLKCDDFMEKFYIHFNIHIIPGQDLFDHIQRCYQLPLDDHLAMTIKQGIQKEDLASVLAVDGLLRQCIAQFVNGMVTLQEDELHILMKYRALFSLLQDSCTSTTTVQDLADAMEMSVSTLSKHFKRDTGYSLKHYIDKKLMERAKKALLFSEQKIYEVAETLEFTDQFYFSRYFKRHEGMSPTTYRRSNPYYLSLES